MVKAKVRAILVDFAEVREARKSIVSQLGDRDTLESYTSYPWFGVQPLGVGGGIFRFYGFNTALHKHSALVTDFNDKRPYFVDVPLYFRTKAMRGQSPTLVDSFLEKRVSQLAKEAGIRQPFSPYPYSYPDSASSILTKYGITYLETGFNAFVTYAIPASFDTHDTNPVPNAVVVTLFSVGPEISKRRLSVPDKEFISELVPVFRNLREFKDRQSVVEPICNYVDRFFVPMLQARDEYRKERMHTGPAFD